MIITEPLKYLIKRANKKYRAKTRDYIEQMLLFTQKIANGYYIEEKQKMISTITYNNLKISLNRYLMT